jgi:hypothetical protein
MEGGDLRQTEIGNKSSAERIVRAAELPGFVLRDITSLILIAAH